MISAHNYFPFLFDLYLFVYTSCLVRPYEARAWEERRGSGGVPSVLLPECFWRPLWIALVTEKKV